MFISKKRNKSNPNVYVQIVESFRNSEGKVRQRVIKHVGSGATEEQIANVVALAEEIKSMLESEQDLSDIKSYHKNTLKKNK